MKIKLLTAFLLAVAVLTSPSPAQGAAVTYCPDSGAYTRGQVLYGMCWPCLFPILIGAVPVGTRFPDIVAPPVCVCPSKALLGAPTPGTTVRMWKPTHFVETVSEPGCMPTLGQNVKVAGLLGLGLGGSKGDEAESTFRSVHLYSFPTKFIADMVTGAACAEVSGGGLDLLGMTELDPTWSNVVLSQLMNPEALLFNNPVATASCMADAAAAGVYKPIDGMFWCQGSWGNTYPLMGYGSATSVQDASLLAARLVAIQHKRLMMWKTYGPEAVCTDIPYPVMPKQQYRWQIFHPIPQPLFNEWTGRSTLLGREPHHIATVGEDWVQILWRYEECCMGIP